MKKIVLGLMLLVMGSMAIGETATIGSKVYSKEGKEIVEKEAAYKTTKISVKELKSRKAALEYNLAKINALLVEADKLGLK